MRQCFWPNNKIISLELWYKTQNYGCKRKLIIQNHSYAHMPVLIYQAQGRELLDFAFNICVFDLLL